MNTVYVIIILISLLVGILIGQMSVWRCLRKKEIIRIGEWTYEAYQPKYKTIYDI